MNKQSEQFCSDFLRGQTDCKKGVKLTNQSDAYYRGHKAQETENSVSEYFRGKNNV